MQLTDEELIELESLLKLNQIEDSRKDILKFTETTFKKFKPKRFHKKFYDILTLFALGIIKNVIFSMPPQHGKSEGSSRRLPAFVAGIRPDVKVALISYAATKAQKFGREIMSIMREPQYKDIFPDVQYPERGYTGTKANTNESRESINSDGSMKFVGVGGALTGDPVDMLIMDDLYKDWQEGNSPIVQQRTWDWYTAVAETRLHNDSQQLIVFTRWSENDLVAILEEKGYVHEWDGNQDIRELAASLEPDQFIKINIPAIKEDEPSEFDNRTPGEPLWPERHSLAKLISSRDKDPDKFDCLHQGNPTPKTGLLYGNDWKTYSELPQFKIIKNYTDTADTGTDKLCSIVYGLPLSKTDDHYYVLDVLYTDKPMEDTEPATAEMLIKNRVKQSRIESNNGGRGFARQVQNIVKRASSIFWFHQGGNKESRIYSNSAAVKRSLVFPDDWHIRWPEFYKHVTKYKKEFSSNKFDDAPDAMTGIIETEITSSNSDDWGNSGVI
ncbi:phage terminase large subunit [uncultured Christiangramia sp.]|uniref:phage terminase large subunit n=1 Tax=uncultured Christiangramia sp. TaxID=503836 RepID=UPI00262F327F|nr:phage terminase large subunit [uncultured Christiangramia sp.]